VAAGIALVPFRTSTTVRESGWFAYDPDEPVEVEPPPPVVVEGNCRPPLVEAWPPGRDQVRAVTRGEAPMSYEAVDGRLQQSCDAPAARRLALSALLLIPAGILLAVGARRAGTVRS
jgi:hypothetical protein